MYTPKKREYEADFLYFNLKSRRLTEVEIKINKIDFQNDFNKPRYHDSDDVSYLYYALPSDVYEKHKDFIDSKLGDAGLILIDRKEDKDGVYFTFGRNLRIQAMNACDTFMKELKCYEFIKKD